MGRRVERLWPAWVQTVGAMHDHSVKIYASCRKCGAAFKVDLPAIIAMKGRRYSLIGRTSECRLMHCDGRCFFLYSPSDGTPYRPLLT